MSKPTSGTLVVDTTDLRKSFNKLIKQTIKHSKNNTLLLNGTHIIAMLKEIEDGAYRFNEVVMFVYRDDDGEEKVMVSTPIMKCTINPNVTIGHMLQQFASDKRVCSAAELFMDAILQVVNHFNHKLHNGEIDSFTLKDDIYAELQKCQAV